VGDLGGWKDIMIYYEKGSIDIELSSEDLKAGIFEALEKLGKRNKVLAIPPDYTLCQVVRVN
jgi:hypothetical protein